MYKPEKQRAIKEEHWRKLVAGQPVKVGKRRRRAEAVRLLANEDKWAQLRTIGREELDMMRHVTREVCRLNGLGQGTAEHQLLCTLEGCLSTWPRVRLVTVDMVRARYRAMLRRIEEA